MPPRSLAGGQDVGDGGGAGDEAVDDLVRRVQDRFPRRRLR
ncbi:hypothetical protein ACFUJ0_33100 [Streptomyces sp. NPDC057242]